MEGWGSVRRKGMPLRVGFGWGWGCGCDLKKMRLDERPVSFVRRYGSERVDENCSGVFFRVCAMSFV